MSEKRDQPGTDGTGAKPGRRDDKVDRASADSFPASDPPSYSGVTGAGEPEPKRPDSATRDQDTRPTGLPTSERHATETAHQWEDQEKPASPTQGREI